MHPVILHHFDASPFSEKIRALLGYKQLAWRSVRVPRIMPKPDLVALTGGYRKTPVMQIGRDLYCETRLIARTVETLAPTPCVLPAEHAASIAALEHLADRRLFLAAFLVLFGPAGRANAGVAATLDGNPRLLAWADRMALLATASAPK